jgi:hypothetical protein
MLTGGLKPSRFIVHRSAEALRHPKATGKLLDKDFGVCF